MCPCSDYLTRGSAAAAASLTTASRIPTRFNATRSAKHLIVMRVGHWHRRCTAQAVRVKRCGATRMGGFLEEIVDMDTMMMSQSAHGVGDRCFDSSRPCGLAFARERRVKSF